MKLLFIESDGRFFEWLKQSLSVHDVDCAANVEAAVDMIAAKKYDACFVDISGMEERPCITVAKTRTVTNGMPLIILTGKEVRADLVKICDGYMWKSEIADPAVTIPAAARAADIVHQKASPMDRTTQLFSALSSLRLTQKIEGGG